MGNSSIKSGSVCRASRQNNMKAYDALPRSVRQALQDAAFDWAPYSIKRNFERGAWSAKELVKQIATWDSRQIKKDRMYR